MWVFDLNGEPMSALVNGTFSVPAFSGFGNRANRRSFACTAGAGPIPPATYYIFDRQSGGCLGWLRDLFSDRDEWFALYAADSRLDDETFCDEVKRGWFRLHPKGPSGRSEGCVVVESRQDFHRVRTRIKSASLFDVAEIGLKAYGMLVVR